MKTAGVVLDSWKLSIFKKHLDNAGYTYTQHSGPTKDTLLLKVEYKWVAAIQNVIVEAERECKNAPKQQTNNSSKA